MNQKLSRSVLMKKIADFIVEKRTIILIAVLLLAGVCGFLIPKVGINTDMTKYLPDSSSMKIGMDIMDEEFPDADPDYTIRVMFRGLTTQQKTAMQMTRTITAANTQSICCIRSMITVLRRSLRLSRHSKAVLHSMKCSIKTTARTDLICRHGL